MAKINDIKLGKTRKDGYGEIIVRLYVTKQFCPQFRTGLFIKPGSFLQPEKGKRTRCTNYVIDIPRKGKHNFAEIKELSDVDTKLALYLKQVIKICDATSEKHADELTTEWITTSMRLINKEGVGIEDISYQRIAALIEKEQAEIAAESIKANKRSFFEIMEDFRDNAKKKVNGKREGDKSDVWKKNFNVLIRALKRYEMFIKLSDKKRKVFALDIDTMDCDMIEDIESFLRNEHHLLEDYPKIFQKIPASTDTKRRSPKPQQRGNNAICTLFNKFKAFYNWANEVEITTNNPFKKYEGVTSEHYGTPYYITLEERNLIADHDLSDRPQLAIQRDIFIFHCCVGCRISDLYRLTSKSIVNGVLEYVPHKTLGARQNVVRVPLNARASALVEKYKGVDSAGRLFPFISQQHYNESIKEVLKVCGVTRLVTILDSLTGKPVQKPINEVASSHMARRCFVGNLYKKVKDPNLIGSMSGHAEGSKAFARYREIDDEVKKEVVSLID